MTEKRYRTEQIQGATLPFIVDNYSAKKHKTMTGYKAYDTKTVKKCDELTDLLNELQDKCDKKQEHIVILENKIHRMREAIHKLEKSKNSQQQVDLRIFAQQVLYDLKKELQE